MKKDFGKKSGGATLRGFPVSDGLAIGAVALVRVERLRPPARCVAPEQVDEEIGRFSAAVARAAQDIADLQKNPKGLSPTAEEELSLLLDAHLAMLKSSRLSRGVESAIKAQNLAAETALVGVLDDISAQFAAMKDGYLAGRAEDVEALGQRLLRLLLDRPYLSLADIPTGSIVLADEFSPADTVQLDFSRMAGFATVHGGIAGHTAIMARSFGIPAVLGVTGLLDNARNGMTAIIDAVDGRVIFDPSAETLREYTARAHMLDREKDQLKKLAGLPAITLDGEKVVLQANFEVPRELPAILAAGAQGIGLFRTEFMFMNRRNLPDEDEQARVMADIVTGMAGKPVTFRTLDIGGDKLALAMGDHMMAGANPSLGLRAIRLSLKETDLFKSQLRAILRAGACGPIRILLPMVTTTDEVAMARALILSCHKELKKNKIPCADKLPAIGVMIEIPAAALAADQLASVADFFSLGTNDLIQYTMAIDRGNDQVAFLYDPLNPAVLRLIEFTVQAGLRAGIPVGICGEMASNPAYTPLLLGLGIRDMSLGFSWIPAIKRKIREIRLDDAQKLAERVMDSYNPADIKKLVT